MEEEKHKNQVIEQDECSQLFLKTNFSVLQASKKIANALQEFEQKGYITSKPILVGFVEDEVFEYSKKIRNPLQNRTMYFTGKSLVHARRVSKTNADIAVSPADFETFPCTKSSMHIYYDTETKRYTYTDGKNKFILEPNVPIKMCDGKILVVSLVTATKMRATDEFNMQKYVKLK